MKRILYLCSLFAIPLLFSSCEKVEGCMDPQAANYNPDAEEQADALSCLYSIEGVWETTSAILNGQNLTSGIGDELHFFWNDGTLGTETYALDGSLIGWGEGSFVMTNPGGNTNLLTLSATIYDILNNQTIPSLTVNVDVDIMTNANNMSWSYRDFPSAGDTYTKTLVKSTSVSLTDWK